MLTTHSLSPGPPSPILCNVGVAQGCMTWVTGSEIFFGIIIQVATTLMVAGPILTFWVPGQTLFASTSLYSSLVQGCLYNVGGSLWLNHSN